MMTLLIVLLAIFGMILFLNAAGFWFNQGFLGFWIGWYMLESAGHCMALAIQAIADANSNS